MSKRDYYEVLSVSRTCTEAELKAAFRKAAMKHHPDRNPGDAKAEALFKEVNEAYQILSDAQKRAAYDRFGHSAFDQGGGGFGGGFGADGFSSSMADIFDDLFGGMMGGGGGRARANGRERGSDLRYNMEISLDEAFHGKTSTIKVPTAMSCETCSGTGAKAGAKPKTCTTCGGHGRVRAQQGFFAIERTCPSCAGRGEVIDNPCSSCLGAGRVTKERSLSVNVPAGVEDGTRIRLAGEGEAGLRGGPSGDLYIFLSLKPHPFFQRDGADLYCQVPISMVRATLGGEITVHTLDGSEARVSIPAGTQTGRQFKLRGKGMPILRSRDTGDLYIQARVETPQHLTKRQRELLEEFESESSSKTHPETAGFFDRMKDFFENLGGH
jgi:molecular chaperone DnaJ